MNRRFGAVRASLAPWRRNSFRSHPHGTHPRLPLPFSLPSCCPLRVRWRMLVCTGLST
jgi:hypothetical protein